MTAQAQERAPSAATAPTAPPLRLKDDVSISALIAGFVAVMVSYAGPCLIVFQAAKVVSMDNATLSSWIWAISIGAGVSGILLSLKYRAPVITAWSTPGAALLVSGWAAYSHAEAVGAFVVSALCITAFGMTGLFSAFMRRIPPAIVTAMLAGVLFKFGTEVFVSLKASPWLALPMLFCYLAMKRLKPRYAILVTLTAGTAIAIALGQFAVQDVAIGLAKPMFVMPDFTWRAIIGIAVPLCMVTMASQNAPGIAVIRAANYDVPVNPLVSVTGIASLLLAPFGAHGINLAAITAAICTGPEAHEDPRKRYIAGVACGAFYIIVGLFGATVATLFSALPAALVAVVAGLALFGSMASGLATAMKEDSTREAALITFLVTASGVSIAGIGAAFWGLVAGVVANFMLSASLKRTEKTAVKI